MAKYQDKLSQSTSRTLRHGTTERKVANLRALGLEDPAWFLSDRSEAGRPALPVSLGEAEEPVGPEASTPEVSPAVPGALEGMKVVCICKGIKQRTFWQAMEKGNHTQEALNRETGSGSGGCRGRRCGPRIAAMLHKDGSHKP